MHETKVEHPSPIKAAGGKSDRKALAGYALAAATAISLAEFLERRGIDSRLTRKLVHIAAGLSPLYVMFYGTRKTVVLLPYLVTIVANFLVWKRRMLPSLQNTEGTPGIVYFPLAQTSLLALLWSPDQPPARSARLLSALLALALGDAAAALVGSRWGRRQYRAFGVTRSLEGSAAMFAVTASVIAVVRALHGYTLRAACRGALTGAVVGTLAEACSPVGLDNLAVPWAVALVTGDGYRDTNSPHTSNP